MLYQKRKLTRVVLETILSWCVKAAAHFSSEILCSPPKIIACSLKKKKNPMRILLAKKFPSTYLMMAAYSLYGYERFPIFFLLSPIFPFKNNPPNFKLPLQNLPRRVPLSLNSNGKFPCKSMKFLKLNNWMNK